MSRSQGVDVVTGEGLAEALRGVDADHRRRHRAVARREEATDFFTAAARNLQAAGERAGVRGWSSSRSSASTAARRRLQAAKLAHEQRALAGPMPAQRSCARRSSTSSSSELVGLGAARRRGLRPAACARSSWPRAPSAEALVDLAEARPAPSPSSPSPEIAGPREERLLELARLLAARRCGAAAGRGGERPGRQPGRRRGRGGALLPARTPCWPGRRSPSGSTRRLRLGPAPTYPQALPARPAFHGNATGSLARSAWQRWPRRAVGAGSSHAGRPAAPGRWRTPRPRGRRHHRPRPRRRSSGPGAAPHRADAGTSRLEVPDRGPRRRGSNKGAAAMTCSCTANVAQPVQPTAAGNVVAAFHRARQHPARAALLHRTARLPPAPRSPSRYRAPTASAQSRPPGTSRARSTTRPGHALARPAGGGALGRQRGGAEQRPAHFVREVAVDLHGSRLTAVLGSHGAHRLDGAGGTTVPLGVRER